MYTKEMVKVQKHILLLLFISSLLCSCDRITGGRMEVYNITVPIEEIYNDIMENKEIFEYDLIELIDEGKTIHIFIYGFNAGIKYIISDKKYLFIEAVYLNAPSNIVDFTLKKISQLKDFFKEKYNLKDDDFVIKKY
jgi:hypothetical protein